MSVLVLHKRPQEKGVSVNLKSFYRLAVSQHSRSLMLGLIRKVYRRISRAASLSEFHFARLFKTATGATPFQFVTRTYIVTRTQRSFM
jgi:AraC-like DNA-binding protein